jgi:hypothetical protein
MGHVQDRWYKRVVDPVSKKVTREKTSVYGVGDRYKVRYVDHSGRERSKTFPDRQKKQADDYLSEVEGELRRGTYIDPSAGKITFEEYATRWLRSQSFDESTRESTGLRLRLHVFPAIGARNLDAIRPSDVRELLRALQGEGACRELPAGDLHPHADRLQRGHRRRTDQEEPVQRLVGAEAADSGEEGCAVAC